MTSLLGRMLPLFIGVRRVEDLFTEAVARLFERRPDVCLGWLEELDVISAYEDDRQRHVRVSTQKSFVALDEHGSGGRPDLIVEISLAPEGDESEPYTEVVMIESKIGSWEGEDQLKRYAGHLNGMSSMRKTLVYITRAYDPKDGTAILAGIAENVRFEQLRWHDFYRFLQTVEKDALIEEVMAFMEEQGMARSYRFSTADLMALSGVPRAFELFDETLGGEVRTELESFSGNKVRRRTEKDSVWEMRFYRRYGVRAPLYGRGDDLFCDVGYQLGKVEESAHASILRIAADGYPAVYVFLEAQPGAEGREISVAAMKRIALGADWEAYNVDNPAGWAGVRRVRSLAGLLGDEDQVAAVQRFFAESIRQLEEALVVFKKEHPDLLWDRR